MALVVPTPRQGSWVKINPWDKIPTPQPRQGTWSRIDNPKPITWTPQPRQGTWSRIDKYEPAARCKTDGLFGWAIVSVKSAGGFIPTQLIDFLQ